MTKNKATFHKQFYSSKAVFGYKVHRHRCPGPRLGATMLLPDLLSRHRRTIPPPHSSSLFLPEPHTEMRRRDRRWDSEIRPVRCSTSSFRTWSYHRIPSSCLRHFWWKASRVLTSADCKVQVSAAYSNTDETRVWYIRSLMSSVRRLSLQGTHRIVNYPLRDLRGLCL